MLPKVLVHVSVSADGRIDGGMHDLATYYALAGKWGEDATLAGSETIAYWDEKIPPEDESAFAEPKVDPDDDRAILAVIDSRGKVRSWHAARASGYWSRFVALCTSSTPKEYLGYLKKRHIDIIIAGKDRVDLKRALEALNRRYGVRKVRVESGGVLNGLLLRAGLVHEVSIVMNPELVGGTSPKYFFMAEDLKGPEGALKLHLLSVRKLKNGMVHLRYRLRR